MGIMLDFSRKQYLAGMGLAILLTVTLDPAAAKPLPQAQTGAQSAPARPIGSIKSISGNLLTLSTDAGATYGVSLAADARILRIEPGAKDLKNASPLQFSDLQVGDRILVMGKISEDGHSVAASSVIVMKKSDVMSRQEHDRQDWQKRGVGGLVSAVDLTGGPSGGTITIIVRAGGGSKNLVIHTSKETILRRYAPDSVNFEEAKPSSLDQIKSGDQLLARGTRNADGGELAAEEIVSGSFRNIAGTISSIDVASNTLSVTDLIARKQVDVKVTPDSQLRKIPPEMAQLIASRLRGGQPGAAATGLGTAGSPVPGDGHGGATGRPAGRASEESPPGGGSAAGGRGGRSSGGGDLQQILNRVPRAALSELQKGDAVMIVSTVGNGSSGVTAITLVSGVEPILAVSPNGGAQSMILPPWSMDAPAADATQ
jgi:hypothetical protein